MLNDVKHPGCGRERALFQPWPRSFAAAQDDTSATGCRTQRRCGLCHSCTAQAQHLAFLASILASSGPRVPRVGTAPCDPGRCPRPPEVLRFAPAAWWEGTPKRVYRSCFPCYWPNASNAGGLGAAPPRDTNRLEIRCTYALVAAEDRSKKAGIQQPWYATNPRKWIPACAGMTSRGLHGP